MHLYFLGILTFIQGLSAFFGLRFFFSVQAQLYPASVRYGILVGACVPLIWTLRRISDTYMLLAGDNTPVELWASYLYPLIIAVGLAYFFWALERALRDNFTSNKRLQGALDDTRDI